MSPEVFERTPDEIELSIEQTRASLDRKLAAIERRLSPREQLSRMRRQIHPDEYVGWAAVGAVLTGTWMAISGWRRYHHPNGGPRYLGVQEVTLFDCDSGHSER